MSRRRSRRPSGCPFRSDMRSDNLIPCLKHGDGSGPQVRRPPRRGRTRRRAVHHHASRQGRPLSDGTVEASAELVVEIVGRAQPASVRNDKWGAVTERGVGDVHGILGLEVLDALVHQSWPTLARRGFWGSGKRTRPSPVNFRAGNRRDVRAMPARPVIVPPGWPVPARAASTPVVSLSLPGSRRSRVPNAPVGAPIIAPPARTPTRPGTARSSGGFRSEMCDRPADRVCHIPHVPIVRRRRDYRVR